MTIQWPVDSRTELVIATKNTTEIDFIGLMTRYLDRVNVDPKFFLTLLLECESTKISHLKHELD